MKTREISGTYGSGQTPCTVLVAEVFNGIGSWYCVEGSVNVNYTPDDLAEGVDVETVHVTDFFTAGEPIDDLDSLEAAIES